MKTQKLDVSKTGPLCLAVNSLMLEKYVEDYYIGNRYVEVQLDCWRVRITAPMDNALQFELLDGNEERLVDSVVTDCVNDALPIRRVILSLLGKVMLECFKNEWDGYTTFEGDGS